MVIVVDALKSCDANSFPIRRDVVDAKEIDGNSLSVSTEKRTKRIIVALDVCVFCSERSGRENS